MKGWTWAFVVSIIIAGITGGFYIGSGKARGSSDSPIEIRVEKYTAEQLELNVIKQVASCCELTEAHKQHDGWTIHVTERVAEETAYQLFTRTSNFVRNLRLKNIDVREVVFEIKTDTMQDIWGNRLKDVTIVRLVFDKDRYEKVNWSAVRPQNVPHIAIERWLHEEVEKSIKEEEKKKEMK